MEVLRANCTGACYGVQRALDMALEAVESHERVCSLGPLIHNPQVVSELQEKGLSVIDSLDEGDPEVVLVRSHGVAPEVLQEIDRRGFQLVDATCPHVARAQRAAAELGAAGCCVLVVGEKGHPEVEGLVAYASQTDAKVVVVADPREIPDDLYEPVGVVVQTTQKRSALDAVLQELDARGMQPQVKKTICSATSRRQDSAAQLASTVDAMVVIGGRNSSNTTRLASICTDICPRTFHVEDVAELQPDWFADCGKVGVTAGASTPESHIVKVEEFLRSL